MLPVEALERVLVSAAGERHIRRVPAQPCRSLVGQRRLR
jgi:hypothetical protein